MKSFEYCADVVVCGGGPSGIMAALAAARGSASVLLIDRMAFLGGMASGGLVNPISEFRKNGKLVITGLPWTFAERMSQIGGALISAPSGNLHFDPEAYKLTAQRLLLEAGVQLLLDTEVVACQTNGSCVQAVTLCSGGMTHQAAGACFIDCTGNGDVASLAGVPMQQDAAFSSETQPASLCFMLAGVDLEKLGDTYFEYENTKYANSRIRTLLEALPEGQVPIFGGPWFCRTPLPGVVTVNMTRIAADYSNPISKSRAICALREDVHTFVAILKRLESAFANAWLVETGALMGIRESRRIRGLYTLTAQDILSAADFEDTIAYTAHPIDIHRPGDSEQNVTFLQREASIPYRCLIPVGHNNLLVSGRCISADRQAFASLRVQGPAMALGQAAGAAAAIVAKEKQRTAEVSIGQLHQSLQNLGWEKWNG